MIDEIYSELKKNLTAARLKEITIAIIGNYKRKNHAYIARLAKRIGLESSGDTARLFARMVQMYHPDKINRIIGDIEERYRLNDVGALERMKDLYLSDFFSELESSAAASVYDARRAEDEEFGYADDDFGYDEDFAAEADVSGDYSADEDLFEEDDFFSEDGDEYNFIDAVTHHFVGNLDYRLTPEDLRNLDGELDLSGSDIDDLSGVEYCIHLSVLNLSGNSIVKAAVLGRLSDLESLYISDNLIEDISGFAGLSGLRELDISFNRVEDISPLLGLKNLDYLNIVGNPVKTKKVIDELVARGIIVIY